MLDDEGVIAGVVSSTRALHEGAGRRRLAGIIGAATPASTGRTSTDYYARSFAQHGHGRSRPLTRPTVAYLEHALAAVALGRVGWAQIHAGHSSGRNGKVARCV